MSWQKTISRDKNHTYATGFQLQYYVINLPYRTDNVFTTILAPRYKYQMGHDNKFSFFASVFGGKLSNC